MPGWGAISGPKAWDELPEACQAYVMKIEELCGVECTWYLGVGRAGTPSSSSRETTDELETSPDPDPETRRFGTRRAGAAAREEETGRDGREETTRWGADGRDVASGGPRLNARTCASEVRSFMNIALTSFSSRVMLRITNRGWRQPSSRDGDFDAGIEPATFEP